MDVGHNPERDCGDEPCRRDREDPGPDNPARDTPFNSRQSPCGSDSDNRACDRVRC